MRSHCNHVQGLPPSLYDRIPGRKAKNKGLFKPSQAFILACYSNQAAKQTRRPEIV